MAKTVVGVFDNYSDAQQVQKELIAAGFDNAKIKVTRQSGRADEDKSFWQSLKETLGFGDDYDDDKYGYREAFTRGGTIVSVVTDEAQVDRVITIMQRYNVVDLDARLKQWRTQGAAATGTAAGAGAAGYSAQHTQATTNVQQGQQAIPVVEEQLQVGKRETQGAGSVRIHSRVVEQPVQEQVNLREERVHVERRPVDRPAAAADLNNAFQEKTIEARETIERPVVQKEARVVEEVVVNKDVQQRTETVRDTVRRTEVDVEKIPAEFATELSSDNRFKGRNWNEFENDAKSTFEQRYPGQWNTYRDRIRDTYERGRTDRSRSST